MQVARLPENTSICTRIPTHSLEFPQLLDEAWRIRGKKCEVFALLLMQYKNNIHILADLNIAIEHGSL